jgi:tripartite-type tricarboxylate transporter receptor subunit TctC
MMRIVGSVGSLPSIHHHVLYNASNSRTHRFCRGQSGKYRPRLRRHSNMMIFRKRRSFQLSISYLTLGFTFVALAAFCNRSHAQVTSDFYNGRTITIICGFAAGGGYDTYARLLSRHFGRHVPGNPRVIVQNMTGAGSVRAANYVYVNAPKDGTVIAAVNQNMPMYQLLGGPAAQFNATKFNWLGSIVSSNGILFTWHTSPTKTLADAYKRETIMGGSGTQADSHIFPTLLNNLLGTRFKVVNGYSGGTTDINLAVERGEVEGRGGTAWASVKSGYPSWIAQKLINVIIQFGLTPEPELPGAPILHEVAKTQDDKDTAFLISLPIALGYGYWLAPEVPSERLAILREAWSRTMKDPELLAEAQKAGLLIKSQGADALAANVARAAAIPTPVLNRASVLLEWKK